MNFVILDLEWNGSYSKKVHRYFNEIIEIGAVKLDERLHSLGTFQAMIKPVVSKKITNLVTDLTGIDKDELKDGVSFQRAIKMFGKLFDENTVLLTWSTSDLMVLLENITYFTGEKTIGFAKYYADAQAFCQKKISRENSGQQMGLSSACEALGISDEDLLLHRAKDDSILTARVFKKVYVYEDFEPYIHPIDDRFYERLYYKPKIITKVSHPLVKPEFLQFRCPECHEKLHLRGKWRYSSRMLNAELRCSCGKK